MNRLITTFLLLAVMLPLQSRAELTIEITQGVEGALPIAVVPFDSSATKYVPAEDIATIIASDLRRSGRFAPLPEEDMISRPSAASDIRFADWRTLAVDNLVIGSIGPGTDTDYRVEFRIFDVYRGQQIAGYSLPASADRLRHVAHRISDIIYEKLTGQPGAFATRIAYVISDSKAGSKEYRLQLADSDGYNPKTLLTSPQPLMSPAWSPDGRKLAYVSFETGKATIFIQEIATGKRREITSFDGINGAPAWSPDGRNMLLTLSRDGNPEIYQLDLTDNSLRRLTVGAAIDTEPAWSPDGSTIVFTSDRGGSPQLYRMPAGGGQVQRLTFEGNYNSSADFSPDGKNLALVHAESGRYRIAVLNLENRLLRVLTDGTLDESPSFSPNGSMIIYATETGHRGVLAEVSSDGRFRQRLSLRQGNVREPVWGPLGKP